MKKKIFGLIALGFLWIVFVRNKKTSKGVDSEVIYIRSYFEDLYSFSVSGHVVLYDGQGLLQKFQLLGYEYLRVDFGRVKSSPSNISRTFRIYTSSRKQLGNHRAEQITLHFCSEELMLSESIKLQKGAPDGGEEIHKTVTRILQNDLKVKKNKIHIYKKFHYLFFIY